MLLFVFDSFITGNFYIKITLQFMQQVDQIRMDSGSDCQLSESYSNSLIEIKNHNLRSSSDSDRLSFGTVSSCADLTYSDDDGECYYFYLLLHVGKRTKTKFKKNIT